MHKTNIIMLFILFSTQLAHKTKKKATAMSSTLGFNKQRDKRGHLDASYSGATSCATC